MKGFVFKFESLEKVRKIREDEALLGLARAQTALVQARQKKQELEQCIIDSYERKEKNSGSDIPPSQIAIEAEFVLGTKVRILHAERFILKSERAVEKSLRTYLSARRQTRMIEILRERAISNFKTESQKKDQRRTDDLMLMRHTFQQEERESE